MSGRRKNIFVLGLDDLHGDDLYADNMHYMGGCLLTDNLSESTTMFSVNSCPPDPDVVGTRWREMWFDRLEHSCLSLEQWLRHQRRNEYWRHATVRCVRITAPFGAL